MYLLLIIKTDTKRKHKRVPTTFTAIAPDRSGQVSGYLLPIEKET